MLANGPFLRTLSRTSEISVRAAATPGTRRQQATQRHSTFQSRPLSQVLAKAEEPQCHQSDALEELVHGRGGGFVRAEEET
jgi:hypothetical protein